jgi:dTMP kinase
MAGLLVAIEGPKSVGKTTLVNTLKGRPETRRWVFTKEPTGNFDLGYEQRYTGLELTKRIASDRAAHLAEVIMPALGGGQVVVTDRYVLSSFAFHCRDGVEPDVVADLNREFRPPDILMVLLCSPITLGRRRTEQSQSTRLSEVISPEQDLLGYLAFADRCRPVFGRVDVGYHESMMDSAIIADQIITDVTAAAGRADD